LIKLGEKEKELKIQEINKLYGNPDYDYFFNGIPLKDAKDIFIVDNIAITVEIVDIGNVNIGAIRLGESTRDIRHGKLFLNIFDYIYKNPAISRIIIRRNIDNLFMIKFDEHLVRKYKGRVITVEDMEYYLFEKKKIYHSVLTIDIDFLFKDMNKYQSFIDTTLQPRQSWQVVGWKTNNEKFKPDIDSYEFVKNVINKKCVGADVVHISTHEKIVDVLRDRGVYLARMCNIDYHHDINYQAHLDDLNAENWATYARHNNYIRDYAWIRQDDSEMIMWNNIQCYQESWKDSNVDNFSDFDLVVICTSKHFVPPEYWGLAAQLVEVANVCSKNAR
jgi:hypothetical protein